MDKFIKMKKIGSFWRSTDYPAFEFCIGEFGKAFDLGSSRKGTMELSTHKPAGSDWYKIGKRRSSQYWQWKDRADAQDSPWSYMLDDWLTRNFGGKSVYVTFWLT